MHIHHFAKAELKPVDWLDSATWQWRIDEETRPRWLDDVEGQAEEKARSIARHMVLRHTTKIPRLIADGCWIIGGQAVVCDVREGRIMRVQGSAQISQVGGSAQIFDVWWASWRWEQIGWELRAGRCQVIQTAPEQ